MMETLVFPNIPYSKRSIMASRGELLVVGMDGKSGDSICMTNRRMNQFPAIQIEETDLMIFVAGDDQRLDRMRNNPMK